MATHNRWLAVPVLGLLAGCEGEIGAPRPTEQEPRSPAVPTGPYDPLNPLSPTPTDPMMPVACGAPPPARVWRLSHAQYDRAVAALLGTTRTFAASFELEASGSGFKGGADSSYVSGTLARQYFDAAETLAAAAITQPARLLPCTPADAADAACVRRFIAELGRRAFREPLAADRAAAYFALYQQGPAPLTGVQMVIEAMLQSPYFLYRRELGLPGQSGEAVALTPYELAGALSFLLWDAPPDDALLEAAAGGSDAVKGQLDRMLLDAKARTFAWRFVEQGFELERIERTDKDGAAFPTFTPQLAADLHQEAERFVDHVTWSGTGTLAELLTAEYSMLNARLAQHYGVSGVSGTAFTRVNLPPGQRAGLLTHAGLLSVLGDARSSSPVQRGLFVRSRLLCQEMPAPPPDVVDTIAPPSTSVTTRERYQEHLTKASCAACHKMMDPIGFGLEGFDGIGRHRTTENGVAVDTSGELVTTRDIDGTFVGPGELARKLAGSAQVSDCVATRYFRFALGRVETQHDACSLVALRTAFKTSGTKLSELVRALTGAPAFNLRVKP